MQEAASSAQAATCVIREMEEAICCFLGRELCNLLIAKSHACCSEYEMVGRLDE